MAFNKKDLQKRAKLKLKVRIRNKKNRGMKTEREERGLKKLENGS